MLFLFLHSKSKIPNMFYYILMIIIILALHFVNCLEISPGINTNSVKNRFMIHNRFSSY